MDKQLALAMDFKKAPKELQDAATAHYASSKALTKAEKQKIAAETALSDAQAAYQKSQLAFKSALQAWEPEA